MAPSWWSGGMRFAYPVQRATSFKLLLSSPLILSSFSCQFILTNVVQYTTFYLWLSQRLSRSLSRSPWVLLRSLHGFASNPKQFTPGAILSSCPNPAGLCLDNPPGTGPRSRPGHAGLDGSAKPTSMPTCWSSKAPRLGRGSRRTANESGGGKVILVDTSAWI